MHEVSGGAHHFCVLQFLYLPCRVVIFDDADTVYIQYGEINEAQGT